MGVDSRIRCRLNFILQQMAVMRMRALEQNPLLHFNALPMPFVRKALGSTMSGFWCGKAYIFWIVLLYLRIKRQVARNIRSQSRPIRVVNRFLWAADTSTAGEKAKRTYGQPNCRMSEMGNGGSDNCSSTVVRYLVAAFRINPQC